MNKKITRKKNILKYYMGNIISKLVLCCCCPISYYKEKKRKKEIQIIYDKIQPHIEMYEEEQERLI